jgi:hypothetical protein
MSAHRALNHAIFFMNVDLLVVLKNAFKTGCNDRCEHTACSFALKDLHELFNATLHELIW